MPKPLDLEPIKAREAPASPGPWKWTDRAREDGPHLLSGPLHDVWEEGDDQQEGWNERWEAAHVLRSGGNHTGGHTYIDDDDASFIARARTDVPALVAEVEGLREALVQVHKDWIDESKFLRERIARLNEDIVDVREGRRA